MLVGQATWTWRLGAAVVATGVLAAVGAEGGGAIFAEADPPSHMDYYLLDVPRLLRACLMQAEATEQVRWLRAFKAMQERSILLPASALKIDGRAYHHGGHYFQCAFAAVPGLAETVQKLSDTP
ncbi:MAG: hypothetical protein A3K19_06280 [Lentisphaerae bacterium RIFOXYB12_FULL_65_16]|nr:MAG: hypothetical protein A3K18_26765 [Lentisphaerae bacterium RIFOXYA12_64_32]OGV93229.1 MAG: hypothetical protein A3K19_06280 [Lentisphaerae bacterium RIFOXYB12_FULL_65_16]